MNLTFLFKTASVLFVLCFVISVGFVEAERSIRLRRKSRSHISPTHTSLSGGGTYARRYSYGRPIPSFTVKPGPGRNRRNFKGRRNGAKTYASGYRNWTPNHHFPGGRNNPRVDKVGVHKKRKERFPAPGENFGFPKQKRKTRPFRASPIQRPFPPKNLNEFDEDYYFPEEAKRGEIKYDFESRYPRPKKKRRNPPGETEKIPKNPEFFPKRPYYDEKKSFSHKAKIREPPVSYSTFIQHPHSEIEDLYEEAENEHYSEPVVRSKKKRVKKKTSSSKKKNKDEDYQRPFTFEKDEKPDLYPSVYAGSDDYQIPAKTVKKGTKIKPSFELGHRETFTSTKYEYSKPKPQVNNIFSASEAESHFNDYRGGAKTQENSHFNPSYSQSWNTVVESTSRPVQYQTENGFQPQTVPIQQYNYQNRDYSSLQKTKTVTTNTQQSTYYSQPDNTYKNLAYNYASNQVSTTNNNPQPQNNQYNYNNVYSNQPSPTYSQPSPSYISDITVQKSVPIYDNTETFYNFNNNAYVNSQSSKYFGSENQNPNNRLSTTYRNSADKSDTDEFIKKHQNLYNNGLSGVPVQGDGYGKENVKKDYDIGYGDFQFDENPTS